VIGAATLLIAGFSALAQTDLKRILAYSTISQIGYMFLAMGIGAWTAAVFHFMMHAFFKALLFLSGGAVIHVLHDEHDIFRMGGLSKKTPVLFITFLAGAASLAALPLVTAGFYSKDEILWLSWSASGNHWMWFAGITGSLLTSLYIFRLVFIVFFGEIKTEPTHKAGILITIPLIILAFFSIAGGFIEIPENIAPVHLLKGVFAQILPDVNFLDNKLSETLLQIIAAVISIGGIFLAWLLFFRKPSVAVKFMEGNMNRFFLSGWGFDRLYDMIVVRPFIWLSQINKNDFIDKFSDYVTVIAGRLNHFLSLTQNGRMRLYVLVLTAGIVILLTVMISL
jgi:NADH-quinone oxidoreductase subunit L